ncbi:MAG: hypothetical protein LQ339_005600 [Xanthoria mediterranea]|nr:MAG: hypothetical protein LQ339_005600 [Xanthoria mediterranea]
MSENRATIEVAVYYPLDRSSCLNPDAWVLYIDDPATQQSLHRLVYQPGSGRRFATVEGRYGCHPRELPRYKERRHVGYIDPRKVAEARNAIQQSRVWQSAGSHKWVIDVLEDLQQRGYARLVWRWMEWFDYNRNSKCGD